MSLAVEMFLVVFSLASFSTTCVLIWYVRKVLLKMAMLVDEDDEITNQIKEYVSHLEYINGLEMFYGDETIAGLLRHSKELSDVLEERASIADLAEEDYEEEVINE